MRKTLFALAALIPVALLISALSLTFWHTSGARAAATCTATGFYRDNINLTAAMIVTTSNQTISGPVNAAGCNIGIYFGQGLTDTISGAQIFGANYFGVVNNGSKVTLTKSQIHDIGENPLNGDQHGVAIYWSYDHVDKGTISNNLIWNYQKGGIVVNGYGTSATISHNTVIGQGPVNYIAQNGIQIGYGAKATVSGNIVTGNSYTGSGQAASGGILVVGGSCYGGALTIGIKITNNTVIGNDVGVYLSNLDGTTCIPTTTPTNIVVNKNIITNDAVNNTTGAGTGGYQAGISDQGDYDQMTNNSICGLGYTPVNNPPPYLYMIDVTVTNNPTVSNNTSCLDGSPVTTPAAAIHFMKHHAKAIAIK
ncbi:MAG TPA: right-handed parallel beta-helix repeat-containing protein [Ktedonobacteraceae bacterium]|nr:right-handed parallel beta-helix repeat-containing protein [Ktedonobacteraceae bacterium]